MTHKEPTEYFKEVAGITLSEDQKARMRETLSAYADFHTVAGVTGEPDERLHTDRHMSVWGLFTWRTRPMYIHATLLAALVLGGGTAAAAESALPGDPLYPMKVHVNENVRGAFAIGANAEATLQTELLNERIEEAEALAAEGALSGETAVLVEARIAAQAEAANRAVLAADSETQLALRTDLASALLRAKESAVNLALDTNAAARQGFAATTEDAAVMSIELAGELDLGTRIETAAERIASLQALIEAEAALGADARADFASELEAAVTHIEEAEASFDAGNEAAAEVSVAEAETIAGEIESALSLMGEIEIDPDTGTIIDIEVTERSALDVGL